MHAYAVRAGMPSRCPDDVVDIRVHAEPICERKFTCPMADPDRPLGHGVNARRKEMLTAANGVNSADAAKRSGMPAKSGHTGTGGSKAAGQAEEDSSSQAHQLSGRMHPSAEQVHSDALCLVLTIELRQAESALEAARRKIDWMTASRRILLNEVEELRAWGTDAADGSASCVPTALLAHSTSSSSAFAALGKAVRAADAAQC
jgi:hypothetical protein